MKKICLLVLLFILAFTSTAFAISGHAAVHFDTLNHDWLWELEMQKSITSWFSVGTNMITYAPTFGFKHFIPAWAPARLDYDVFAEVKYKNIRLRLSSWCDHWFSQSGVPMWEDKHGLAIRAYYEF